MNAKKSLYETVRILSILVLLYVLLSTTTAVAASVTLRWDRVDPAPEGYRLFARKSTQAFNYSQPNWVGTAATGTINDLEDQTEYYFVVRAYDGGLMSSDSNEVHYIPPLSFNPPADITPPSWDGATAGIGLASDTATGGSVTVEFDTAHDVADGTNLKFNVYYAASGYWNQADWTGNSVIADATVGAGSTFTHAVTLSGLTDGVRYTFGVRVEDQSGNEDSNSRTLTATPTVSAKGNNTPYQQDPGPDGLVSIAVENYDAKVSRGGHDWVPVYPAGYSGSGAMQAQPNTGAMIDSGYVSTSPRLDYTVNFVHTGIHYVWVRGLGANKGADSVHVGLDGHASATSDRMSNFTPVWRWSNDTKDQAVARVYVATAGIHTVNVWMREDGFVIDKLALTVKADFTPH